MSAVAELETMMPSALLPSINWEALLLKNKKKIYYFIRRRVSNLSDVEDLLQSTCVEVLTHKARFYGASCPDTWIFGIAMNLVRNYYRSRTHSYLHQSLDEDILDALSCSDCPARENEYRDLLHKVLVSMNALPESSQQLLNMALDDDLSYQDIAEIMAIPVGTVRSRLSRLRQTIRDDVGVFHC
ncbi:RNA polymerase sigma factor [[Erwinia] mediterraneensis]|uniref:RNA polymerase sigma factor n=1 Tax=[Erwinia] mediterraneensis TaxID=2161819 RepID=UPI001030537C|nr:sigma-70 family RNA polymerase sigma factor [[Erwinia] mediterraneensis]